MTIKKGFVINGARSAELRDVYVYERPIANALGEEDKYREVGFSEVISSLDECIGDYAQTEVATHYFWIADYTSM